jgi:hypothetical protein
MTQTIDIEQSAWIARHENPQLTFWSDWYEVDEGKR